MHIARAYGVRPGPSALAASTTAATPKPQSVHVTNPPNASGTIARLQPTQSDHVTQRIDQLIGAKVANPINFDGTAQPRTTDALPLYTRQADRAEAAVALQVGRAIDVTG